MPIVGIIIQMIISQFTGFNPDTGDIAKTYYYGFFLGIVFAFICAIILKKSYFYSLIFLLIVTTSSIHIFGFPKNENSLKNDLIAFNNQVAYGCNINKTLFDIENSDCVNEDSNFCEYMYLKSEKVEISNSIYFSNKYDLSKTNINFKKDDSIYYSSTFEECSEFISKNFKPVKLLEIKNIPYLNLFSFVMFFGSIIYFLTSQRNILKP